jgi:hypothetical protein
MSIVLDLITFEPEDMSGSLTPDGSGLNVDGITEGVANLFAI